MLALLLLRWGSPCDVLDGPQFLLFQPQFVHDGCRIFLEITFERGARLPKSSLGVRKDIIGSGEAPDCTDTVFNS